MPHFNKTLGRCLVHALVLGALLSGCGGGGGGGGGDEFVGAALVEMLTQPKKIDTGDRTRVTVRLRHVNENGISLKLRYPTELIYVLGSSFLKVSGDEVDVGPTVNSSSDSSCGDESDSGDTGSDSEDTTPTPTPTPSDSSASECIYLVYFFSRDSFDDSGDGELTLELEAEGEINDGLIEVDPDVDDPSISNDDEFDIDEPEFAAEDKVSIKVLG